jgi:DNA-binding IclR family transcriptional regulator
MMRSRQTSLVAEPNLQREDDPRFVIALARGLSILKAFKRGDAGVSNQQLAARTGLAKATISRLTYTLTRLGYLDYSSITGRYSLSVSALALGFTALGGLAVRDLARPFMQSLADRLGCSVAIAVPDKRTMVYIEHCRGPSPLHIGVEVGSHIRMVTSAMGRAYLASLDSVEREKMLDELCPDDESGDIMRAGIQASVKQFLNYGYVTSIGEWKQEVNSVGVPLSFHGSQSYALNCGGSALILKSEMLDSVGRELVEMATRIRRSLENSV